MSSVAPASRPRTLLVVDDDEDIRVFVHAAFRAVGYQTRGASSAEDALAGLDPENLPDAVLADLRMPGMSGLEMLREMRRVEPDLPIVIMTSHGSMDSVTDALRHGATDFIAKPLSADDLTLRIGRAISVRRLETENRRLREELAHAYHPASVIAISPVMRQTVEKVERLAEKDSNVLLVGESGTGKDLLARVLHFGGPRARGPFVAVNCGALPSELVESELFGHAKGAFTGAVQARAGKLEAADGGTLLLDEVGELPLDVQPKFLRALETRTFERVGENAVRQTNVRIVTATHRNLRQMVEEGQFREDLYYRLAVVPITVPPLRERPEDIGPIARYLIRRIGGSDAPELSQEAVDELSARSWPGNVRELANVLERILAFHEGGVITAHDLRDDVPLPTAGPARPASTAAVDLLPPEGAHLDDLVNQILRAALERSEWNQSAAARLLRVPRHVIQYRMKKFGISARQEPLDVPAGSSS